MNVLVIDDDQGVRATFGGILKRAGFDVTAVGGSVAAFAKLKRQAFQAIVCDVILPVADGTSLYERLLQEFPEMADRVIFVSSWVGDEKVKRLLEYTGRPYLMKPVKIEKLVETVRQVADRTATKR